VPRELISPVEYVVEVLRAILVAVDIGLVPNAHVPASLGRAFLVSKKNNLHIRVQKRPTLEGIPLGDRVVAHERLGSSEKSDHVCVRQYADVLLTDVRFLDISPV
jgi:hypothetical protein